MSIFDLWVKGCKENKSLLFLLEGSGENALYKVTKEKLICNNYFYETSVFIGWTNGKQVCATTDYVAAYNIWKRSKK